MKNRFTFIDLLLLLVSTLLFLAIIGLEVYDNTRIWNSIEWSELFATKRLYMELPLFIPYFIYFISKLKGEAKGVYRSIWLKIIMALSSLALIINILILLERSHLLVTHTYYTSDSDPISQTIYTVFIITGLGYYLNMLCWIVVYLVKSVVIANKRKNQIQA